MATENKDFRVKNGLVVQGTNATVNGNSVLTSASNIADLSDVSATTPSDGDVLSYSSGSWGPAPSSSSPATTESAGIVELATNAETQAGTDTTRAVTPAGLASLEGYRYVTTLYYKSSGTFTKADYPWLRAVRIKCVGGGGGGGGAGTTATSQNAIAQAGSGGGYAEKFISNISIFDSTQNIFVGAGGSGGSAGAFGGTAGGASYVGTSQFNNVITSYSSNGTNTVYKSSVIPPVGSYVTISNLTEPLVRAIFGEVIAATSTTFTVVTNSDKNAGNQSGELIVAICGAPGGTAGLAGAAAAVPSYLTGSSGTAANGGGDVVIDSSGTDTRDRLFAGTVKAPPGGSSPLFMNRTSSVASTTGFSGTSAVDIGCGGSGGANAQSQTTTRSGGSGASGIVMLELYA